MTPFTYWINIRRHGNVSMLSQLAVTRVIKIITSYVVRQTVGQLYYNIKQKNINFDELL